MKTTASRRVPGPEKYDVSAWLSVMGLGFLFGVDGLKGSKCHRLALESGPYFVQHGNLAWPFRCHSAALAQLFDIREEIGVV